jgi:hypothetical protein
MSQNVWATIMPCGPVTNFLLAQKKFWASFSRPSFQALGTACSKKDMDVNERLSNITLKVGTACSKKDMDVNERLSNITLKDELK